MHQYSHAWDFFLSLKVLCDYISAIKTETDRGFMVIIIVIRVFHLYFTSVNETFFFSREKQHWSLQ